MANGGHTRLERGVLAVLLRPGSIPTSSAAIDQIATGRRAGVGRTSSATRIGPLGGGFDSYAFRDASFSAARPETSAMIDSASRIDGVQTV